MTTMLVLLILLPLLFGVAVLLRPPAAAKWWALGGTSLCLAIGAMLVGRFFANASPDVPFQAQGSFAWLPALGLNLSVGIDSVATLLIGLTLLLGPICVGASWTAIPQHRARLFYGWLLVLQAAMVGVFAARDLLVFYTCFEFTLLPMFVMINEFGSTNRHKAATKFFLYTFTGSIIALAGLVYTAWAVGTRATGVDGFTLDIATLTEHASHVLTAREQALVLLAMLCGFAVKVPLFPFHTWLPLAHTEAPTAGSVILAGVLLKLGTYAMYRFVLPLVPHAVLEHAPAVAILAIIGIIYAGLICWVQTDVKKLVAYSSVSHLGFCVLGLFALNSAGVTGSVLYMLNHGLSTGALFLLVGFMYERYHTRDMREIGGLGAKMPIWSTFMVFFVMSSVGLPGLNGFPSEFLCTMGAFISHTGWTSGAARHVGATWGPLGPWFGFAAGTGVIVAAIYLLAMVAKMVWGTLREPAVHHGEHDHHAGGPHLPVDLTAREIMTLLPIGVLCIVFGLFPTQTLIGAIESDVNAQVAFVHERSGEAPTEHEAHFAQQEHRQQRDAGRDEQIAGVKP
ncbi:MAG: NADH-quinone oxidoreductase subunit M [Phycisphaeraceae bacterium]|nr:MAG: NADH-quinone oxidoreductase subunit M [Phycisphaeraceae bacterium]